MVAAGPTGPGLTPSWLMWGCGEPGALGPVGGHQGAIKTEECRAVGVRGGSRPGHTSAGWTSLVKLPHTYPHPQKIKCRLVPAPLLQVLCLQMSWVQQQPLTFKFWEVIKGCGNILCYFLTHGLLYYLEHKLEGRFLLPGSVLLGIYPSGMHMHSCSDIVF